MQTAQAQPQQRLDRSAARIMIIGGTLGLLAAFELIIEKMRVISDPTYIPSCDINPVLSCGSIIITPQAEAFGFPNPILGLIGFSVVITIGVTLASGAKLPRWMWLGLNAGALLGFFFIQWLIWQSLYSIGALCPWCMVVWAVTVPVVIWITAANLSSGRIPVPQGWQTIIKILADLRVFILIAWYLLILGLIFVRWQNFWINSI